MLSRMTGDHVNVTGDDQTFGREELDVAFLEGAVGCDGPEAPSAIGDLGTAAADGVGRGPVDPERANRRALSDGSSLAREPRQRPPLT